MENYSLFSIGFRSESICRALVNYQANEPFSKMIIEDSVRIIEECFTENHSHSNYSVNEFVPLIVEIYRHRTLPEMVAELSGIKEAIKQIKADKTGVEITSTLQFFKKLSSLCLSRSRIPASTNSFAFA
jgi:hypothetical protein